MGVDLTGASVGVDGSSRVTMQNSSNVSCVRSLPAGTAGSGRCQAARLWALGAQVLNISGQQMRGSRLHRRLLLSDFIEGLQLKGPK